MTTRNAFTKTRWSLWKWTKLNSRVNLESRKNSAWKGEYFFLRGVGNSISFSSFWWGHQIVKWFGKVETQNHQSASMSVRRPTLSLFCFYHSFHLARGVFPAMWYKNLINFAESQVRWGENGFSMKMKLRVSAFVGCCCLGRKSEWQTKDKICWDEKEKDDRASNSKINTRETITSSASPLISQYDIADERKNLLHFYGCFIFGGIFIPTLSQGMINIRLEGILRYLSGLCVHELMLCDENLQNFIVTFLPRRSRSPHTPRKTDGFRDERKLSEV